MVEFNKTLSQTTEKLEKLSKEKLDEAEKAVYGKVMPANFFSESAPAVEDKADVNRNKKEVVNLEFGCGDGAGGDGEKARENLRQLLLDLDSAAGSLFGGVTVDQVKLKLTFPFAYAHNNSK